MVMCVLRKTRELLEAKPDILSVTKTLPCCNVIYNKPA